MLDSYEVQGSVLAFAFRPYSCVGLGHPTSGRIHYYYVYTNAPRSWRRGITKSSRAHTPTIIRRTSANKPPPLRAHTQRHEFGVPQLPRRPRRHKSRCGDSRRASRGGKYPCRTAAAAALARGYNDYLPSAPVQPPSLPGRGLKQILNPDPALRNQIIIINTKLAETATHTHFTHPVPNLHHPSQKPRHNLQKWGPMPSNLGQLVQTRGGYGTRPRPGPARACAIT